MTEVSRTIPKEPSLSYGQTTTTGTITNLTVAGEIGRDVVPQTSPCARVPLRRVAAEAEKPKTLILRLVFSLPVTLTSVRTEVAVCLVTVLTTIEEKSVLSLYIGRVLSCVCIRHVVCALQPKTRSLVLLSTTVPVSYGVRLLLCCDVPDAQFAEDVGRATVSYASKTRTVLVTFGICAVPTARLYAGCTVFGRFVTGLLLYTASLPRTLLLSVEQPV